ncbi:3-oxoacyl-ACP reductase FabG [Methylophilaceae bacterium]|jgi:3-oxoacyl-[acyl-carrier protein] reductase|nr:3-oxoacyl-ACP reductase FabG [Methylophilaceae bacterium]|tara:strand:+ start:1929 stop:2678 length:750 start_codon:yes stop_codon:yes gene_type:complete
MSEQKINKIALVTGASRGIGASIALELAKNNMFVIGTATSGKGVNAIKENFELNKQKGAGLVLNVNDNKSIESLIKNIEESYGDINILVNNAGITKDTLLMKMKDEDWDEVINTNLKSVFKLSQSVVRKMMKNRYGRIINISSVVGHTGNAGQTNYTAAKAGMSGFTKSLAQEIGSRGVTVNCVAPGFIDTDMTRNLPEDYKKQLLNKIPLGKLGSPNDIANAVAFLASDDASYITGETLHINGGMLMV